MSKDIIHAIKYLNRMRKYTIEVQGKVGIGLNVIAARLDGYIEENDISEGEDYLDAFIDNVFSVVDNMGSTTKLIDDSINILKEVLENEDE